MAAPGDNAALRATIAALVAVAVFLAFVTWQSVDATLQTRAEEARDATARVDALAIAREVDRAGSDVERALASAIGASGVDVAAGVYDPDGSRQTVVGLERLVAELPGVLPTPPGTWSTPVRLPTNTRDVQILAVRLDGGNTLVVARGAGPVATWSSTLAAYQALTLLVVLAIIAFALRRLGRATQAHLDAKPGASGALPDGPRREAELVVETFQSVIGELQVKGRQLELESLRERERADRSERFSERVIAQMPTGLVVIDRSDRVTAANQSARDIFAGLPRERTDAVDYESAFATAPALGDMVGECLAHGTTFQRREIEMRVATGEARARCLGVSVSPIGPPDALPEAVLCLMTDLTEVIDLRDRLRVQETMASLGEMAAGLTHELKNSLATIQGFAQLIADIAPESTSEPAEELVEEVGQLARMVTDFLNFARPQEVALTPVAVVDLLETAAERFAARFDEAEIDFALDAEASVASVCVLGDETLLGRALLNIVQNAVEALETSPRPRRLRVAVRRAADDVVVEVSDNGPGIPAEDLPKIFIPFFTTRSRGHGIGLALTQKIVISHGGRISAENATTGAIFRCALPIADAVGRSGD